MEKEKQKLIKIIQDCKKEEDFQILQFLMTKTFPEAIKVKREYQNKVTKNKESMEEDVLNKYIRSFSDFPNIKEGNIWNYIEKNLDIYTVNDLIHTNPYDLLRMRGFGRKKLQQIEEWLEKHNLSFVAKKKYIE